jgi:hypothetical protein
MHLNLFQPPEFELPHPPIAMGVLLVVEEAIRVAWEILKERPPAGFDILTAGEGILNHHLRETLQDYVWNRQLVEGFDGRQIACVTSAEEVRDYSGRELKKKPDMIVKLVGMPAGVQPSQFGIVIECKPVDKKHTPVSCYCGLGIKRFVDGRYAWAMQEAMMIGYIAHEDDPVSTLSDALDKCRGNVLPIGKPTFCPLSITKGDVRTVITRHSREFHYVGSDAKAPEILLRHIWLRKRNSGDRN